MTDEYREATKAVDRHYEADNIGNLYEHEGREVWPTGVRFAAWASRSDITQEEFDRLLRDLDELDRRLSV